MDTNEKLKRPWWGRKRTWAAVVLWLAAIYVPASGPAVYALTRGWLPRRVYIGGYSPLFHFADRSPTFRGKWRAYKGWWIDLAIEHRMRTGWRPSTIAEP